MVRLASMMATAALLLSADASGVLRTPPPSQVANFSPTENHACIARSGRRTCRSREACAERFRRQSRSAGKSPGRAIATHVPPVAGSVSWMEKLCKSFEPIPAGKKGFHLKAGVPLNENALRMAVASAGSAINPGDHAQITNLDFKEKEIIMDINGGGRGKTRLRDRIHLEVGGVPTVNSYSGHAREHKRGRHAVPGF